ncbi:MAG TPA: hypothetical protein VGG29_20850 [Caulobacteraceae bacterium]|jgi:hypothetical protein
MRFDLWDWLFKHRVTVHLRSGERLRFLCRVMKCTFHGNDLHSLNAEHSVGFPHYLRLDDVSAITTERVTRFARR